MRTWKQLAGHRVSSISLRWGIALLAFVASPLAVAVGTESSRMQQVVRHWTLSDIVEAPTVTDLAIARNGRSVLYVVRQADLATNAKRSRLHRVDLVTGTDQELRVSSWFSGLQAIPGADDWSVLADLGEGVQLYRVDGTGRFDSLQVNHDTAQVGGGDEGYRAFGITDYGWTPNGTSYWYQKPTPGSATARIVNPKYFPVDGRQQVGPVELRIRHADGRDVLVDRDEATKGGFHMVAWEREASSLSYWIRLADQTLQKRRWIHAEGVAHPVEGAGSGHVPSVHANGLRGGGFETRGLGAERQLVEAMEDGSFVQYGHVRFSLGDPRASGTWRSPDGGVALLGTRYLDVPRYGLARVTSRGSVEELGESGSLTNCSVNDAFTAAACIRQSMVAPPELVALDPRDGGIRTIVGLAPRHAAIPSLKVVARTWTNRNGFAASGFVVYPRKYEAGRRYPAILVTHGSDADERFVDVGFQWDYPIQVWAERGYVVVAMNDPTARDSEEMLAAYAQWGAPGPLPRERVQDLIWINGVLSFEDAIEELAAEGLVDPERVGIAGYSRGSQMVNVTMTQSKAFRAASSGDGGFLEPMGYFVVGESYRSIYGGSPFDSEAAPLYQRLSPTFRVEQAAGPILQQVAIGSASQFAFHVALREANVPSELVYYQNETHLFHQPRNRLSAMEENIDWFDFWLLGETHEDEDKADQYQRWKKLREAWKD